MDIMHNFWVGVKLSVILGISSLALLVPKMFVEFKVSDIAASVESGATASLGSLLIWLAAFAAIGIWFNGYLVSRYRNWIFR